MPFEELGNELPADLAEDPGLVFCALTNLECDMPKRFHERTILPFLRQYYDILPEQL